MVFPISNSIQRLVEKIRRPPLQEVSGHFDFSPRRSTRKLGPANPRKRLYIGFGALHAVLVVVTLVAITKVQAINSALPIISEKHVAIQRYAINFRGSAHDRAIAARDVVLRSTASERQKEIAAIEQLARLHAESAGPLEVLLQTSADAAELRAVYG